MKRRTADNCSFTSNVSTNVLPFSKRIWIRVLAYDFGVLDDDDDAAAAGVDDDDVEDGSAMVTVSGVLGFPLSLCKQNETIN